MKILLMGHQMWACMVLERLLSDGHEIAGTVTEKDGYDDPAYADKFGSFGFFGSLKEKANELGLDVYQPDNVNSEEFLAKIGEMNPNLILIMSYHSIIKRPMIDRWSIINLHGSLLPKYRGRAPINWAIINGETECGATAHFVDEGIDTGDIILRKRIPIYKDDTSIDVLKRSLPLYPELASEAVRLFESGKIERRKQSLSEGCYFPRRGPEDGRLDWSKTSEEIYDFVRALAEPYPNAFCESGGKKVHICRAEMCKNILPRRCPVPGIAIGRHKEGVRVTTRDGCVAVMSVREEGGGEVPAGEYFRPGERLS